MNSRPAIGTPYGRYAGFISRAIAFVIDALLITVSAAVVLALLQFVIGFLHLRAAGDREAPVIAVAAHFVITWLYLGFFWWLAGQTPGKWFMGLRIIGVHGERLRVSMIVRRLIGYYVATLFFCLGFLWVLFDDRRQDWPDKLAGTFVVYSWPEMKGVPSTRSIRSVLTAVGLSSSPRPQQQERQ
jgi:uncharacterized RDD family membrane protein YckC